MGLSDNQDEDPETTPDAHGEPSLPSATLTAESRELIIANKDCESPRSHTASSLNGTSSQPSHTSRSSQTMFDDEHNAIVDESWLTLEYTAGEPPRSRAKLASDAISSQSAYTMFEGDLNAIFDTCIGLRHATSEPPQSGTIPPSDASQSSHTVFDNERNEIMAESWSASTYIVHECMEIFDRVLVARTRSGSNSPALNSTSDLGATADLKTYLSTYGARRANLPANSRQFTRRSTTTIFNLKMLSKTSSHKGICSPMERFVLQESSASWSVYNMRLPGTVCAYCALTFTGPRHREDAICHIRDSHVSFYKNGFPNNTSIRAVVRLAKSQILSQGATNHSLWDAKSIYNHAKQTKTSPDKISNTYKADTAALGSWLAEWNSSTGHGERTKESSTRQPCAFQHGSIVNPTPAALKNQLPFLLHNLGLRSDVESANIFFRCLNAVVANLLKRYPNDVIVHAMQTALTHLEQSHQLNISVSRSSNEYIAVLGFLGRNTCAPISDTGCMYSPGTTNHTSSGRQNNDCQQQSKTSTTELGELTPDGVQNALTKSSRTTRTKRKGRLLGCPIQKHHRVHALEMPCDFKGAANMSAITYHLNTRLHHEFVPFLKLCRNCWGYVTTEDMYNQLHELGRCQLVPQPRGSRVIEHWNNLYKKLYPTSERIPIPYIDNMTTWRPAEPNNDEDSTGLSDADDLEFDFNNVPDRQSFLGREPIPALDVPPAPSVAPSHTQLTVQENAEAAAHEVFCLVYREHFDRPGADGQHMEYVVEHAGVAYINAFSDALRARLNALIQSHRTGASEGTSHDLQSAILPGSLMSRTLSNDTSRPGNLSAPEGMEELCVTMPTHQSLPHEEFPVDQDPSQAHDLSDLDFIDFDDNSRSFYPSLDLAQIPYQLESVGVEETQSTISI